MDITVTAEELLKEIQKSGDFCLETYQKQLEEKKILELLKPVHQFEIRLASDGRWKSTVKCNDYKRGYKTIAKKSKEKLLSALLSFYHLDTKKETITLESLFSEWLKYKALHTNRPSYISKLLSTWNNHYKNDPIVSKPITELTALYVEKWLINLIKSNNLTKKDYFNKSFILRNCLEYCCKPDIDILKDNPAAHIKINNRLFKKKKKRSSADQIFTVEEEEKIIKQAFHNFKTYKKSTTALIIVFFFLTGLRISEIAALKWTDIEGDYIHIQRSEITDYKICYDTLTCKANGFVVIDQNKTSAGDRNVYLTPDAKKLLEMVLEFNTKKGWYDDNFIFLNAKTHTRTTTDAISSYLETLCEQAHIRHKSSHKTRKSWITSLANGGISMETVRAMAGHESIRTTMEYYLYDRSLPHAIENNITKILSNSPFSELNTSICA